MKVLSAIQPSFFPWPGYFDMIEQSDVFIYYDHVQFDKNGWRNRNYFLIKDFSLDFAFSIHSGFHFSSKK